MQTEFARAQMITQQIRAWDVLDERVLDAMRRTPREFFVPERYAEVAFADTDIPLRAGQHMLAPKIVGRLLQALDAQPGHARAGGRRGHGLRSGLPVRHGRERARHRNPRRARRGRPRQPQARRASDRSKWSRVTLSTWIWERTMRSLRYVAPFPCTTIASLAR